MIGGVRRGRGWIRIVRLSKWGGGSLVLVPWFIQAGGCPLPAGAKNVRDEQRQEDACAPLPPHGDCGSTIRLAEGGACQG